MEVEEEETCYDSCFSCGAQNFFYDSVMWEATCRECGVVNSFEVGCVESYVKPKTYFKHNYFTSKIISDAMTSGFKIDRMDMREYERLFRKCVQRFYETQEIHKRKYMINANFTLWKISLYKGQDAREYVKMPKKGTLRRLEEHWEIICPW